MSRIAALVIVSACAEQGIEYPGPPELVLGLGHDELTALEDGDAVPIVKGPQGGTIVWGAVSGRYLDPEDLELVFSIVPPEGAPSLRRVIVDLEHADGGLAVGVKLGLHVFLPDEDSFAGLPCVWRVEARDREGRVASGGNRRCRVRRTLRAPHRDR
jgi:hypothetical protein